MLFVLHLKIATWKGKAGKDDEWVDYKNNNKNVQISMYTRDLVYKKTLCFSAIAVVPCICSEWTGVFFLMTEFIGLALVEPLTACHSLWRIACYLSFYRHCCEMLGLCSCIQMFHSFGS